MRCTSSVPEAVKHSTSRLTSNYLTKNPTCAHMSGRQAKSGLDWTIFITLSHFFIRLS